MPHPLAADKTFYHRPDPTHLFGFVSLFLDASCLVGLIGDPLLEAHKLSLGVDTLGHRIGHCKPRSVKKHIFNSPVIDEAVIEIPHGSKHNVRPFHLLFYLQNGSTMVEPN
jgi:hypothetical protein